MHLLYLDESGDLGSPELGHVVLAGVRIHETFMRTARREIHARVALFMDEHLRGLEIHAQHMHNGKGSWRGIPREVSRGLLESICALMSDLHREHPARFECMAVVRSPGALPGVSSIDRQFEELLMKFNTRIRNLGDQEFGMVVADDAKYEAQIQPRVHQWREAQGTRFGRLTRIAEVPLFSDSASTPFLQLADVVAHVVFLAYERNRGNYLDLLLPAFESGPGGRLDGFMHLTASYPACPCAPCISRNPQPAGDGEVEIDEPMPVAVAGGQPHLPGI